jgi:hypothetical protein
MSLLNDNPNRFKVPTISRRTKSVGKLANDMRLDETLVDILVNERVSQRLVVIAGSSKKERNND